MNPDLHKLCAQITVLAAGTAAYLYACRALNVRELDALLALRHRLRRG